MANTSRSIDEDINPFGPGSDLLVSLAAALLLLFVLSSPPKSESKDFVDLETVRRMQRELVSEVRAHYPEPQSQSQPSAAAPDASFDCIELDGHEPCEVSFRSDLDRQSIAFGSSLLFAPDQTALTAKGRLVLNTVVQALLRRRQGIARLQIEGHADTSPSALHGSNFELAAARAISVFSELHRLGFDPAVFPISISSFGEFQSVARSRSGRDRYSWEELERDNESPTAKSRNRRTEILVFYRRSPVE